MVGFGVRGERALNPDGSPRSYGPSCIDRAATALSVPNHLISPLSAEYLIAKHMAGEGTKNRKARLANTFVGAWSAFSFEYLHLCIRLYMQSAEHAKLEGGISPYTYAGIPLLFSTLRALLIECNSGMYANFEADQAALARLATEMNELAFIRDKYGIDKALLDQLTLVYEIRNEMVHPAHRPAGTKDMTPDYLRPLKDMGILRSSGDPNGDYPWMHQLQSHKLFSHAFHLIEQVASVVIPLHEIDPNICRMRVDAFGAFRAIDR